eukprot:6190823-Pleurochrysis_carterae.AAC.3
MHAAVSCALSVSRCRSVAALSVRKIHQIHFAYERVNIQAAAIAGRISYPAFKGPRLVWWLM